MKKGLLFCRTRFFTINFFRISLVYLFTFSIFHRFFIMFIFVVFYSLNSQKNTYPNKEELEKIANNVNESFFKVNNWFKYIRKKLDCITPSLKVFFIFIFMFEMCFIFGLNDLFEILLCIFLIFSKKISLFF